LGFTWKKGDDGFTVCHLSCDHCGFVVEEIEVYSLNIPEVTEYERKNKWFNVDPSKENSWKFLSYCFDCAVALGYRSLEGEKLNECKENGIIEGIETVPTRN